MKWIRIVEAVCLSVTFGSITVGVAAPRQLRGHVPSAVARLQPISRLGASEPLRLSLGLPLRNQGGLALLLRDLYDPASPGYHRFLSPEEFTTRFGPTEQDYESVLEFARTNGLSVVGVHPNRVLVDVSGSVRDVERAFGVAVRVYQHPTEARTFYAPDAEPSVESGVPLLAIRGLTDYVLPQPRLRRSPNTVTPDGQPRAGSGPSGNFLGNDFRKAYVPGTTLTGAGQSVGLFELDGYYATDITNYEFQAGLPNVPLKNVLIDGFSGTPSSRRPGSANEEVALDIEMAISMAPGLDQVLVYEGSPNITLLIIDDVLNRMATDNLAKQLSCSWGFDINATTRQIFQQYAAQGQSFYLASGDTGAFSGPVDQPSDEPYITVVGGTTLSTSSTGAWASEVVWNGSGGGISTVYPIPDWQKGISMSANKGSTTMRNLPDVAMVAQNVWIHADRGSTFAVVGTSIAAPLWAGFTALVNEQGAATGAPPVGFVNPALYAIGKSPRYTTSFHDITSGNNRNTASPSLFSAVAGYDLCTGWGSPKGTNLINDLLAPPTEPLLITSPLGFVSSGPIKGPFKVTSQAFTLANQGSDPLDWAVGGYANWLNVAPLAGTLAPANGSSNLTVSLSPAAATLLLGTYTTSVLITNLTDGTVQNRDFSLLVGNSSFENGDFSNWHSTLDKTVNLVVSTDQSTIDGQNLVAGFDDSIFVHSGLYGAFLGQNTSLGYLSQTLPTVAGQQYTVSFWLDNPVAGVPNEFLVIWNGTNLFDQTDLGAFAWTNFQFSATATTATTVLQFGFRNDQNAFGLDDVSVSSAASLSAPVF